MVLFDTSIHCNAVFKGVLMKEAATNTQHTLSHTHTRGIEKSVWFFIFLLKPLIYVRALFNIIGKTLAFQNAFAASIRLCM